MNTLSDKKKYQQPASKKQSLTVQQWCQYATAGVNIPVTTLLSGVSMEPLIRCQKDAVTVIPLYREPVPGDIVLFKRNDGAFVVHRVYTVSEEKSKIQTWGDNCFHPDEPIDRKDVLGLAVCVNKNGNNIMLDNEEQRIYGIQWMNHSVERKIWFAKKRIKKGVIKKGYHLYLKVVRK